VCVPYNACPELKHLQRTTLIKLFSLLELVVLFFLVITFAVYGWFQPQKQFYNIALTSDQNITITVDKVESYQDPVSKRNKNSYSPESVILIVTGALEPYLTECKHLVREVRYP